MKKIKKQKKFNLKKKRENKLNNIPKIPQEPP